MIYIRLQSCFFAQIKGIITYYILIDIVHYKQFIGKIIISLVSNQFYYIC